MHFEKVVAGFSRYHKYTLGAELRNQSRAVVSAIVKANSEADKLPALLGLRDRLEELTLLVRLSKEVRAFKRMRIDGMKRLASRLTWWHRLPHTSTPRSTPQKGRGQL